MENLENLDFLMLQINCLKKLENIPLKNLKYLNASNTELDKINDTLFGIEELYISGNNISEIDMNKVRKIKNKCLIDLRNNPIRLVRL